MRELIIITERRTILNSQTYQNLQGYGLLLCLWNHELCTKQFNVLEVNVIDTNAARKTMYLHNQTDILMTDILTSATSNFYDMLHQSRYAIPIEA